MAELKNPETFDKIMGVFTGLMVGTSVINGAFEAASRVSGGNETIIAIGGLFGLAAGVLGGFYTGHAAMIGSAQIGVDPPEETKPPEPG